MVKTLREIIEDKIEEANGSGETELKVNIENSFIHRALLYVPRMMKEALDKTGITMEEPSPCPCGDNSIDFYWKTVDGELLLNVGENGASYYGDFKKDGRTIKLKGELN